MDAYCDNIALATSKVEKNPLMIDVILDLVLGKLPIAQLKKCRLVNKHWDSRACHFLKKSWKNFKAIELDGKGNNVNFIKVLSQAKDKGIFCKFEESLENYMEFSHSIFENQPTKFLKLKLFRTRTKYLNLRSPPHSFIETKIEDILSILKVSSNTLEQLHLSNRINNPEKLIFPTQNEPVDYLLDFNLPHLEKIVLYFGSLVLNEDFRNYDTIFGLLEVIVKKAPKLKSLEFNDDFCLPSGENSKCFLNYLKTCSVLLSKLENLEIIFSSGMRKQRRYGPDLLNRTLIGPKNLMDLLKQPNGLINLKLLKLKIYFPKYQENFEPEMTLLTRFLDSLAENLEFLELDINQSYSTSKFVQINLPTFKNLKNISIGNEGWGFQLSSFKSPFVLDLSTKFPALKKVVLNYEFLVIFDSQGWDKIFTGSSETVEIFQIESLCTENMHLKALEAKFPKVRQFQFITNDVNSMNAIVNNCPWEDTLQVFTIDICCLEKKLDFELFSSFKALERIEFININSSIKESSYGFSIDKIELEYDLNSLLELKIKSLKIHNFWIKEEDAAKIREKFVLDYTLCPKVNPIILDQVVPSSLRRSQRLLKQKLKNDNQQP